MSSVPTIRNKNEGSFSDMVDITDLITSCASSLTMAEPFMCRKDSFLLQDAMAATQLMDRKMDSCELPAKVAAPMSNTKKEVLFPRPCPESLSDPFGPLPWSDLTLAQTSIIVTQQLVRLQAMFSGASVGESVFTCLYAQKSILCEMEQYFEAMASSERGETSLQNRLTILKENISSSTCVCAQFALFTASCALIEITEVFRSIVINADIYEEEDFVSNTHDIPFFTHDKKILQRYLDIAVEILGQHEPGNNIKPLCISLTYLNGLLFFCSTMGKLRREDIVKTVDSMRNLTGTLATGLKSLQKLHDPSDIEYKPLLSQKEEEELVIQVFDSYVNRPLFGNTPVRKVSFLSTKESIGKLTEITSELDFSVCGLLAHGSSMARIERMLRRFSSLNVLSRSLIVLNLFFDELLLGQHALQPLIVSHMRQWEHVPADLIQDPHALAFLSRLAKPVYDILKLQASSRNRQRAYMEASMLREWTSLQNEANLVDVNYRREHSLDNSTPPYFGHYVLAVLLRLMDQHLSCGIEVGLFCGHDEICSAFWYRDFLLAALNQNLNLMRRGREMYKALVAAKPTETKGKGGKKRNSKSSKANGTAGKAKQRTLEELEDALELQVLEAKRMLCRGIVRFIVAVRQAGYFEIPDYEFTSRQTIFENRFSVFESIRHPPPLTFQDYLEGSDGSNISVEEMCQSATEVFKTCRALIESVLNDIGSVNATFAPVQEMEARSLLRVCVGNSVYLMKLNQLAAGGDTGKQVKFEFDFEAHKEFCIVKFQ
mmetsp:Transcript_18875/g.44104  ORF Transcript_18875/g.44104 Transcript_18875/m.44104 type:complete len:772 (-) Transcript_18875:85-2400(-)